MIVHSDQTLAKLWSSGNFIISTSCILSWNCHYLVVGVSGSFLVPTVDGTDIEGVVCPKDQSRAAVIFTGTLSIRMLANIVL